MKEVPGFLIDGFPANMNQAEIFMNKIQAPHKIIFLDVPEAVMAPRLKDGLNFNDQAGKKMHYKNTTNHHH